MMSTDHPSRSPIAQLALLLAIVLVGLSAGFFFTYEASVTLGLGEVGDVAYVETFQSINGTIRNPAFGVVFFGSLPAMITAVALNWTRVAPVTRALMVAGVVLYVATLAITATGNVPLNDDLGQINEISEATAAQARAAFEDDWNRLNLLRSLTAGGSFAALAAVPFAPAARNVGSERLAPMEQTR